MKNQDHKTHRNRKLNIKRKNSIRQGMPYLEKLRLRKEFKMKHPFARIPDRMY